MPPRPPPPPTTLTILLSAVAVAAAWLLAGIEAAARGAAGTLVGIPLHGLSLQAAAPWTLVSRTGLEPPLSAGALALVIVAGTVAVLAVALLAYGFVSLYRAGVLLRALALEGVVLALLWPSAAFAAAAVPGGGGPVGELYARLGDPQAGRWAAGALGLLLLILLARVTARRAVATGRSWMRADALEFRRRLVRVVAGYPAAVALGGFMVAAGWAAPGVAAGWALVMLITLRMQTS